MATRLALFIFAISFSYLSFAQDVWEFRIHDPDKLVDSNDTLFFNHGNDHYLLSCKGTLIINGETKLQLDIDDVIERAFLYLANNSFYIFFTETDNDYAGSFLAKAEFNEKKPLWILSIPGFNLGKPVIDGNTAYLTSIGSIGKVDLKSGKYLWQHNDLYDSGKYSFNSFDTLFIHNGNVEFISKNYSSGHIDKVIVNDKSGQILEILK